MAPLNHQKREMAANTPKVGSASSETHMEHLCTVAKKKTQLTIERARAPAPRPRHKGGRPRLPQHLQTLQHERQRARHARHRAMPGTGQESTKKHRRLRKSSSPPLPFAPVTPAQKMRRLLEWHATCPQGSQACNVEIPWDDQDPGDFDEKKEDSRWAALQTPPPQYRETFEKRKPHFDE